MRRRRRAGRIALAAAVLLPAAPALAQGAEATVRVSLPVTEAVGVLDLSSGTTDFGTLSLQEVLQGHADRPGPVVAARTNQAFSIVVTAADAFTAPVQKSAGDLLVATDGLGFTPLGPEGVLLFTSAGGGVVARALDYRWLVGFETDPPGDYGLALSVRVQGE